MDTLTETQTDLNTENNIPSENLPEEKLEKTLEQPSTEAEPIEEKRTESNQEESSKLISENEKIDEGKKASEVHENVILEEVGEKSVAEERRNEEEERGKPEEEVKVEDNGVKEDGVKVVEQVHEEGKKEEVIIEEEKQEENAQKQQETNPTISLEQQLGVAVMLKDKAREFIASRQYDQALKIYEEAAMIIDNLAFQFTNTTNPQFINDCFLNYNFLNNNICFCYQKLGNHTEAIKSAEKVLQTDPANIKALYRIATSYLELDDINAAYSFIKQARMTCVSMQVQDQSVKDQYFLIRKLYNEKLQKASSNDQSNFADESRLNNSTTLNTSAANGSTNNNNLNNNVLDQNDISMIANNAEKNEEEIKKKDEEAEFNFRYYSLLSVSSMVMGSLVASAILKKEVKTPFGAVSALILSGNFFGLLAVKRNLLKVAFAVITALYSGFIIKRNMITNKEEQI